MQDAGARRISNAEGMRRMVRKHDCALPVQYTKHSNARGHSLGAGAEGMPGLFPHSHMYGRASSMRFNEGGKDLV